MRLKQPPRPGHTLKEPRKGRVGRRAHGGEGRATATPPAAVQKGGQNSSFSREGVWTDLEKPLSRRGCCFGGIELSALTPEGASAPVDVYRCRIRRRPIASRCDRWRRGWCSTGCSVNRPAPEDYFVHHEQVGLAESPAIMGDFDAMRNRSERNQGEFSRAQMPVSATRVP